MLPVKRRGLLAAAVLGASIIQFLDATIANVALPHMQSSLGATSETVTWILTSYIVAGVVLMPLAGWLSDQVGSRRLFIWSVAGFIVTSMMCGAATSLGAMVLFRTFQGMCGAMIGPLAQTIILDTNPKRNHTRMMAVWGMAVMIAPICGPVIGGWLTENYNWRWVFYINLPIGLPTLALLWWLLPSRPIVRRKLDLMGFSMLALGLAALQLMLDRGHLKDWFQSWEIILLGIVSLSALWIFATHMITARNPLFDRRMFADRNFSTALGFMMIMGMMMVSLAALVPPLLQNIYGYPAMDAGLLMAPRGVGVLLTMMVAARLIGRIDLRILVGSGYLIAAYSLYAMSGWSIDMDWRPIAWAGFIQGIGMGLTFMPMNVMAFATMEMRHRTDGSSLANLTRSFGGSLGIAMLTSLFAHNAQVSHSDLAAHVSPYSIPGVDPSAAERMGAAGDTAMTALNMEVTRQAAMIAYLNDFRMLMIAVLCLLPLVLLLKTPKMDLQAPAPVME